MKAINLCDGGKSCRAVAEEMDVGRTQIMNIIKRKSEILDDFKNNMPGSRKRQRRATGNEDINQLCWDWFQEATGRRINNSEKSKIRSHNKQLLPSIDVSIQNC